MNYSIIISSIKVHFKLLYRLPVTSGTGNHFFLPTKVTRKALSTCFSRCNCGVFHAIHADAKSYSWWWSWDFPKKYLEIQVLIGQNVRTSAIWWIFHVFFVEMVMFGLFSHHVLGLGWLTHPFFSWEKKEWFSLEPSSFVGLSHYSFSLHIVL